MAFTEKHKLPDCWQDVYIVTDQPNHDIPVYQVKQQDVYIVTDQPNHDIPVYQVKQQDVYIVTDQPNHDIPVYQVKQQDVYIVTDQPNHDIPVYQVKQEKCKDKEKPVLYRNMLLPIGFIPTDQEIREEVEVSFSNYDRN